MRASGGKRGRLRKAGGRRRLATRRPLGLESAKPRLIWGSKRGKEERWVAAGGGEEKKNDLKVCVRAALWAR